MTISRLATITLILMGVPCILLDNLAAQNAPYVIIRKPVESEVSSYGYDWTGGASTTRMSTGTGLPLHARFAPVPTNSHPQRTTASRSATIDSTLELEEIPLPTNRPTIPNGPLTIDGLIDEPMHGIRRQADHRPVYRTYRTAYAYGWFGADAPSRRQRSSGYYSGRLQWSFP